MKAWKPVPSFARMAAPAFAAVLLTSACTAPTVPDMVYYRLPESSLDYAAVSRKFELPIDVNVFAADGLYSEQALIFTQREDGRALQTYHYQHWIDPPARLLQRRLIGVLRRAQIAPLVTDRLPASADALVVSGVILRFDRVRATDRQIAEVSVQLRVEHGGDLLDEHVYKASIPAKDAELQSTVDAFGAALDQIYAEFLADLAKLQLERR
ncbi:MAG TPA: ABC-type transport auxiliary lipoprotein family protein [Tahibacter sp.]|nr:ABC-type transport auxiliary lipoprotein family protein [Tahibacter sp.]